MVSGLTVNPLFFLNDTTVLYSGAVLYVEVGQPWPLTATYAVRKCDKNTALGGNWDSPKKVAHAREMKPGLVIPPILDDGFPYFTQWLIKLLKSPSVMLWHQHERKMNVPIGNYLFTHDFLNQHPLVVNKIRYGGPFIVDDLGICPQLKAYSRDIEYSKFHKL